MTKDSHNTGNFIPYSSRIVRGLLNVPQGTYKHGRYTVYVSVRSRGPMVYSPFPRRLESGTINFVDVIAKTALSSQLFKHPER